MGTAGTNAFNLGPRLTITFVSLIVLILGGNALVVSQFDLIRMKPIGLQVRISSSPLFCGFKPTFFHSIADWMTLRGRWTCAV